MYLNQTKGVWWGLVGGCQQASAKESVYLQRGCRVAKPSLPGVLWKWDVNISGLVGLGHLHL